MIFLNGKGVKSAAQNFWMSPSSSLPSSTGAVGVGVGVRVVISLLGSIGAAVNCSGDAGGVGVGVEGPDVSPTILDGGRITSSKTSLIGGSVCASSGIDGGGGVGTGACDV